MRKNFLEHSMEFRMTGEQWVFFGCAKNSGEFYGILYDMLDTVGFYKGNSSWNILGDSILH